ncbi:MAG TPA: hypothetical protein VIK24_14395, partial [Pyrinomonadaceae bacterium]
AVIGVPAGWYHKKPVAVVESSSQQAPSPQNTQPAQATVQPAPVATESTSPDDAAMAAKRQREKDKKARDAKAAEAAANVAPVPAANPGGKRVVVSVTYDESGRVTQASGGDANALRIARQKRFPPGKGGSASVTIPIN